MVLRHVVTENDERLAARCANGRVVIIDDDSEVLAALAALLEIKGYGVETYSSALAYLQVLAANQAVFPGPSCVLCDVRMPEMDGLQFQHRMAEFNHVPLLLMSGHSGAQEAVSGLQAGAHNFLIKPFETHVLLDAVAQALAASAEHQQLDALRSDLAKRVASLTVREREVSRRVAQGSMNRHIADEFGIALRTVKLHRHRAMEKLGASTLADLVRLADLASL
jgi:two-component system response regulator FixJ